MNCQKLLSKKKSELLSSNPPSRSAKIQPSQLFSKSFSKLFFQLLTEKLSFPSKAGAKIKTLKTTTKLLSNFFEKKFKKMGKMDITIWFSGICKKDGLGHFGFTLQVAAYYFSGFGFCFVYFVIEQHYVEAGFVL